MLNWRVEEDGTERRIVCGVDDGWRELWRVRRKEEDSLDIVACSLSFRG